MPQTDVSDFPGVQAGTDSLVGFLGIGVGEVGLPPFTWLMLQSYTWAQISGLYTWAELAFGATGGIDTSVSSWPGIAIGVA